MTNGIEAPERTEKDHIYELEVDGVDYTVEQHAITGAQIMALAEISPQEGLLQILPDGTQEQVQPDQVITLKPGHRFKKRPRFKRG
jgi:hypothetical protein